MSIHTNGYWTGMNVEGQHIYDENLSDALLTFFINENVLSICDFGCGMGSYVKHLKKMD